jgi:choline/glycine/proline betaine transport protein
MPRLQTYRPVFVPSVTIIGVLVLLAVGAPTFTANLFVRLNDLFTAAFGWWYVVAVTLMLVVVIALALSRFGRIRLGRDDERPQFSLVSWFAMLFSAGMGIGLVFYGVAEPVSHFGDPPESRGVEAGTAQAADQAFSLTYFHWGLHAWAVYSVVGLTLGYAVHRRGRPLTLRYVLEPLIGPERTAGRIGDVVDVAAVVGTVFGVATSLGFGVAQINAGLDYLGWVEVSAVTQVVIIVVVTGLAALSVASGLQKGVKILSNTNLVLAGALAAFVLVVGATVFVLNTWVEGIGAYLSQLVPLSFQTDAFAGDREWISAWTIFYWGWWISWSPFVGMFIARISRGRTIRQFVLGVLLAPTGVATVWFAIFGGNGIQRDLDGAGGMVDVVSGNLDAAIFELFNGLPAAAVLSLLTVLIVGVFFITSADSGSLVIDVLASGGQLATPRLQRVAWAVLLGVVAIALLLSGGLLALQTAAIATALPVSIVLVLACVALAKSLGEESDERELGWPMPEWERPDPEGARQEETTDLRTLPPP